MAPDSIAPSLHRSIAPSLHRSIAPSLHRSIAPSLHRSIAPSLHRSIASMPMIRFRRPILLLLALLPLLCVGGLVFAIFLRPPVFYSHHQVISYMLRERGLQPAFVDAALPWPEGVNYYSYGPAVYPYNLIVKVDLSDGRHINGRVECRRDQYECSLTLIDIGIDRVLMPNIIQTHTNSTFQQTRAQV